MKSCFLFNLSVFKIEKLKLFPKCEHASKQFGDITWVGSLVITEARTGEPIYYHRLYELEHCWDEAKLQFFLKILLLSSK